MEPITIMITTITNFITGYRMGRFVQNFIYGEHVQDIGEGFEYLNRYSQDKNPICIDSALSSFNRVDSNDKDFVKGGSLLGKAICYIVKLKFQHANSCLNELAQIEVNWNTIKSDTLTEFKEAGKKLHNEMLKEIQRIIDEEERRKRRKRIIIFSTLAIIAVGVILCFFLFFK